VPLLIPVNQQVTKSIKAEIPQMLPDPGLTNIRAFVGFLQYRNERWSIGPKHARRTAITTLR
jgi:hypothetical protein